MRPSYLTEFMWRKYIEKFFGYIIEKNFGNMAYNARYNIKKKPYDA